MALLEEQALLHPSSPTVADLARVSQLCQVWRGYAETPREFREITYFLPEELERLPASWHEAEPMSYCAAGGDEPAAKQPEKNQDFDPETEDEEAAPSLGQGSGAAASSVAAAGGASSGGGARKDPQPRPSSRPPTPGASEGSAGSAGGMARKSRPFSAAPRLAKGEICGWELGAALPALSIKAVEAGCRIFDKGELGRGCVRISLALLPMKMNCEVGCLGAVVFVFLCGVWRCGGGGWRCSPFVLGCVRVCTSPGLPCLPRCPQVLPAVHLGSSLPGILLSQVARGLHYVARCTRLVCVLRFATACDVKPPP